MWTELLRRIDEVNCEPMPVLVQYGYTHSNRTHLIQTTSNWSREDNWCARADCRRLASVCVCVKVELHLQQCTVCSMRSNAVDYIRAESDQSADRVSAARASQARTLLLACPDLPCTALPWPGLAGTGQDRTPGRNSRQCVQQDTQLLLAYCTAVLFCSLLYCSVQHCNTRAVLCCTRVPVLYSTVRCTRRVYSNVM